MVPLKNIAGFALLAAAAGMLAGAALATQPPLGFDLDISLSAKAAERLHRAKEGLTVDARYYGDPTPGAEKHADEVGQIDLGGERLLLPGRAGPVHVSGTKVLTDRLAWIAGGVKVNVNVYSARLSSSDNLLACDFIDGAVAQVVQAQPVHLRCALIEEDPKTEVKP